MIWKCQYSCPFAFVEFTIGLICVRPLLIIKVPLRQAFSTSTGILAARFGEFWFKDCDRTNTLLIFPMRAISRTLYSSTQPFPLLLIENQSKSWMLVGSFHVCSAADCWAWVCTWAMMKQIRVSAHWWKHHLSQIWVTNTQSDVLWIVKEDMDIYLVVTVNVLAFWFSVYVFDIWTVLIVEAMFRMSINVSDYLLLLFGIIALLSFFSHWFTLLCKMYYMR
jgi:hypothetical protein